MHNSFSILLIAAALGAPVSGRAAEPKFFRDCVSRLSTVLSAVRTRIADPAGPVDRSARLDHEAKLAAFRALPEGPAKLKRALADARRAGAQLHWALLRRPTSAARVRSNGHLRTRLRAYCAYVTAACRAQTFRFARTIVAEGEPALHELIDLMDGYCKLAEFEQHPDFAY